MRRITALISLICFTNITSAQVGGLVIQGVSPDLYVVHNPVAKENYYSVGRLYNVSPKEIAAYNNLVFENGLKLGQPIKIPLTQNNFIQTPDAINAKAEKPVYHVVEAKEGLYRVSVNYNKVPLEQLKKWNHLSSDVVSNGTRLIVGYLKVQDESTLAKSVVTAPKEVANIPKDEQAPAKKTGLVKEIAPEVKNNNDVKVPDAGINTTPVVKEETPEAKNLSATNTTLNFSGGIFKKLYDDQQAGKTSVTENGPSGVFKSTSGWRDGKYYCFNNNAPLGTIAKITNTLNGKSVYAKVLDLIPDISQNAGLVLHVSNAAAEELGVSGSRFDCTINYAK